MVLVCLPSDASRNTYHLTWVSLTSGVGYLLTAAPPDLERGVAPLRPPVPAQLLLFGCGLLLLSMLFYVVSCCFMNSMRRQNDRTLKEELPRSEGAQYAPGDQWRNNSRKNEGMKYRENTLRHKSQQDPL